MEPHFPRDPPARFLALFPSPEGDPAAAEAARYDAAVRFRRRPDRGPPRPPAGPRDLRPDGGRGHRRPRGSLRRAPDSGHATRSTRRWSGVPLVVKGWGETPGTVVSLPVRSIDILPTVLDALALPPESGAGGEELAPPPPRPGGGGGGKATSSSTRSRSTGPSSCAGRSGKGAGCEPCDFPCVPCG